MRGIKMRGGDNEHGVESVATKHIVTMLWSECYLFQDRPILHLL